MTAVWLPDVLSDAFRGVRGYQVDTVSGWRTRSANSTAFEPRGVMNHHTGGGGYAALLNFMTVGSSIAPLSQVATSRPHSIGGIQTVRITIMAAGRCNHAGKGHWSWTGTDGGNRYCIGIENQNDGRQSWPKQQVEGIHIATAAILKHLRQNEQRAIDHKDYAPTRKPDRHSTTRTKEQAAIKAVLLKENSDMPLTEAEIKKVAEETVNLLRGSQFPIYHDGKNPDGSWKTEPYTTLLGRIRSRGQEVRDRVGTHLPAKYNGPTVQQIVQAVVAALPPGQSGGIDVEALADLVAEKTVTLHGKLLHHPKPHDPM